MSLLYIFSGRGKRRLLLLFFCLWAMLPLRSAAQSLEAQKAGLAYLHQLPQALDRVKASIRDAHFGPYHIEGVCGYNSHWYCFGDCDELYWEWNFPDFIRVKDRLGEQFDQISSGIADFDKRFGDVQEWMVRSLPNFLGYYQRQIEYIRQYQAEYDAGDANAKERSRTLILHAISAISDNLRAEQHKIREAMAGLSQFNHTMSGRLHDIRNLDNYVQEQINHNQHEVWSVTESYPCDRDKIRDRAMTIQNEVRESFYRILREAEQFGIDEGRIDASASMILGNLLVMQTKYEGAIETLKKAEATPNVVLQNLNLNITYRYYSDLADYAASLFK